MPESLAGRLDAGALQTRSSAASPGGRSRPWHLQGKGAGDQSRGARM